MYWRVALALVAAAAMSLVASGPGPAGDWPQLGYDTTHSGLNSAETAISAANVANTSLYWHAEAVGSSYNSGSSLAVANGVVYVADAGQLLAYDAAGRRGCDRRRECSPLWVGRGSSSSPAVADGVVYVNGSKLAAFDAAGKQGCDGRPRTCSPLWSAETGPGFDLGSSSPAVANRVVYAVASRFDRGARRSAVHLLAFDAAGRRGCSGRPGRCAPLWSAAIGEGEDPLLTTPTVANGIVFAHSSSSGGAAHLYAFDAAGVRGCAGRPKACSPLWTVDLGSGLIQSPAVVTGGHVYVGVAREVGESVYRGHFYAFDAKGERGCAGEPRTCSALWTAATGNASDHSLAAGNAIVYVGAFNLRRQGSRDASTLYAFDAAGTSGCGGRPKTCSPLWSAEVPGFLQSAPSIANGLVFASAGGDLFAFDAAGRKRCSRGQSRRCSPLWKAPTRNGFYLSTPVVANGAVYVSGVNCEESCGGQPSTDIYAFAVRYTARLLPTRHAVAAGRAVIVELKLLSRAKADVSAASLRVRALCVVHAAARDCAHRSIGYRKRFFTFRRGRYDFTVKTTGLRAGRYKLLFRAVGEPIGRFHAAKFTLAAVR